MSLMGTLAKVAVGVAVAKGASKVLQGGKSAGSSRGNSGLGGLLGGAGSSGAGGLGALLGGAGGQSGGLGDLLEGLAGGQSRGGRSSAQAGGLNALISGFAEQLSGAGGRGAAAGGGLAALAAGLAGKAQGNAASTPDFGAMFNQALANGGEPDTAPTADQEAVAALMLTAMIQAAKSDGQIDAAEQTRFLKDLGEIDQQEMAFLQAAVTSPVDVHALAEQTPSGLETQLYSVSVLAIELDNQAEARYLHELATALGLNADIVNKIHDQLGVPRIYQ